MNEERNDSKITRRSAIKITGVSGVLGLAGGVGIGAGASSLVGTAGESDSSEEYDYTSNEEIDIDGRIDHEGLTPADLDEAPESQPSDDDSEITGRSGNGGDESIEWLDLQNVHLNETDRSPEEYNWPGGDVPADKRLTIVNNTGARLKVNYADSKDEDDFIPVVERSGWNELFVSHLYNVIIPAHQTKSYDDAYTVTYRPLEDVHYREFETVNWLKVSVLGSDESVWIHNDGSAESSLEPGTVIWFQGALWNISVNTGRFS